MGAGAAFAPEVPGATVIPHSNFDSRMGWRPRYVVVHGTATPNMTTAQAVARYFQATTRKTGTHFVVGRDGVIVQCVPLASSAWGNGRLGAGRAPWWADTAHGHPDDVNRETISIEHVKTGARNEDALTPAQAAASFRLIATLCARFAIPMRPADATGGIAPHASIDPVNRAFCPGPYPWAALYEHLRTQGGPPVPTDVQPRTLPNFESISEFPDRPGNGLPAVRVACWVAAFMAVAHAYDANKPMDGQELVRIWRDMTARKEMDNSGTNMSAGDRYVREVVGWQTVYPPAWHYHPGTEVAAIRTGVETHAGINGMVAELGAAHRLPWNEQGVDSHFVGFGGWKVYQGVPYVWTANGDDILALAGNNGHGRTFPARWLSWDQIVAAEPTALLVIVHPTIAQPVEFIPAGWHDDPVKKVLTAKNDVIVEKGYRDYLLAHGAWDPDDVPERPERGDADGSFLPTKYHTLLWTPKTGVTVTEASPLQRFYIVDLDALAHPAPPPPAPVPDPLAAHALEVVRQIKPLVASF